MIRASRSTTMRRNARSAALSSGGRITTAPGRCAARRSPPFSTRSARPLSWPVSIRRDISFWRCTRRLRTPARSPIPKNSSSLRPRHRGRRRVAMRSWCRDVQHRLLARLDDACERAVAERKRSLLGRLHGDVLEIGPGGDPSFGYFWRGGPWGGRETYLDTHASHLASVGRDCYLTEN